MQVTQIIKLSGKQASKAQKKVGEGNSFRRRGASGAVGRGGRREWRVRIATITGAFPDKTAMPAGW